MSCQRHSNSNGGCSKAVSMYWTEVEGAWGPCTLSLWLYSILEDNSVQAFSWIWNLCQQGQGAFILAALYRGDVGFVVVLRCTLTGPTRILTSRFARHARWGHRARVKNHKSTMPMAAVIEISCGMPYCPTSSDVDQGHLPLSIPNRVASVAYCTVVLIF